MARISKVQLLYNLIQQRLNSGSTEFQILLPLRCRFVKVRHVSGSWPQPSS